MMRVRITANHQVQPLGLTIPYEVLDLLGWRSLLGIARKVSRAYHDLSFNTFLASKVNNDRGQVPSKMQGLSK